MTDFDIAFTGTNILIAEDEAIVAMDLMFLLQGAGATVAGPVSTLANAVTAAQAADLDAALLDVNLGGSDVFPAAEILIERGIPFIFHTAHGEREDIRTDFPDVPVLAKPADPDRILQALAEVILRRKG
ncbi:MAG: response regulator [Rhodospirillaceae bacterium]